MNRKDEHLVGRKVQDDYDCIGFDLDNTLAEYEVRELMELEYRVLADFLIGKGYDREGLSKPFRDGIRFVQKGLFMDLKRGNVIKLGRNAEILKACHGTRPMPPEEVIETYGPDRIWEDAREYVADPLKGWNTPLEKKMRAVTDFFDAPSVLIFARAVDSLDAAGHVGDYDVWPDVLEGLYRMFERSNFAEGTGGFFPALRHDPSLYYKKCDERVREWLKQLKKNKFSVLITGSNPDFARLTASRCLGPDWRDLFHAVVCYARKPTFFVCDRPFLKVVDDREAEPVAFREGSVYCQGNWKELTEYVASKRNSSEPKFLYVGDNVIQDVYSPSKFKSCDVVAVSSELTDDGNSFWGSYFGDENDSVTFWNHVIKTHAKICIPNLKTLADKPSDFKFKSFDNLENGYHSM